MMRRFRKRRITAGFTLVELLIVIVVIAILAAITIIAYSNVTSRAELAKVQSNANTATTQIQLFNANNNGVFPGSITDCPTPASTNICIPAQSGDSYVYTPVPVNTVPGYMMVDTASYELTVMSTNQFLYESPAEKHGSNEFMQYTDLAPIINKYGLVKYQLSFDLKSANVSSSSTIMVYFQNGSTARYGGLSQNVTATTSYQHYVLTFTPTMNNPNTAQSLLAFYGTYGTGNIPTVTNVQFQRS